MWIKKWLHVNIINFEKVDKKNCLDRFIQAAVMLLHIDEHIQFL